MKCTDLPPELRNILAEVPYATLATVCPDRTPWNTPVWACFDDVLNMYWASWPGNQHSRNIADNPSIFVVVYKSNAQEGMGLAYIWKWLPASLSKAIPRCIWCNADAYIQGNFVDKRREIVA